MAQINSTNGTTGSGESGGTSGTGTSSLRRYNVQELGTDRFAQYDLGNPLRPAALLAANDVDGLTVATLPVMVLATGIAPMLRSWLLLDNHDLPRIATLVPKHRQTLFFSATVPPSAGSRATRAPCTGGACVSATASASPFRTDVD